MSRYICSPYEDPDCGCTEPEEEFDEDRAYDGYRERLGLVSILPSKGAVMTRQKILREDHDGETVRENEIYRGCTQVCASRCEIVGNIHDNPELLK